tara:strand:- start:1446 stop:1775 length:330 start_codon:yes stop_codon:yes gene_type:complete
MSKAKHVMEFKTFTDETTPNPSKLVAHQLTRNDLSRYDADSGQFRNQGISFKYAGVQPKVGEFLVRFDDEFKPVPTGQVVLVGARRFFQITGDDKALNNLGKLGSATCA